MKHSVSLDPEVLIALQDRLIDRIEIRDAGYESPCWESTFTVHRSGYSRMLVEGKPRRVHRVTYELWVGPIPAGLVIDHLCRNLVCCNPDHLEAVTQRENTMRGESHLAELARRTHCIHGHEFTEENTYWYEGRRACRACVRRRKGVKRRGVSRPAPRGTATHCPHGHERSDENTYISPGGTKSCRICNREAARRYKERKAA